MLENFWKRIINRGVTPGLDFSVRSKIRLFNSSIFIIGCIYIFYTVVSFLKGDNLAGWLTLVAYVLTASCLYMMSEMGVNNWLGFTIWLVVGLIIYFLFSYKNSKLNTARVPAA